MLIGQALRLSIFCLGVFITISTLVQGHKYNLQLDEYLMAILVGIGCIVFAVFVKDEETY